MPERMCMVCRKMRDKHGLIRIMKTKNGEISIDPTYKSGGRGAYICKDGLCAENAQKRKALERAFGRKINQEIYDELCRAAASYN